MAPAKVLQGAVREQGLASSPTPETQVRVACAWANETQTKVMARTVRMFKVNLSLLIYYLLIRLERHNHHYSAGF
jgi:hypothetical protein